MIEVNSIKTQKDLERYGRTAETLMIRSEVNGSKNFVTGPKDEKGNVFWPDAILVSKDIAKMTSKVIKVVGNCMRLTFENGHGEYIILGELMHEKCLVLTKISSSIEHVLEVVADGDSTRLTR